MHQIVQQLAKEYKAVLYELYGTELAELVLFGSYARGDAHEESDVDFAIVLYNPATRSAAELVKTSPIASRLSLKYGLMISSLPVSLHKKQNSGQGVFQSIRNEGIAI
jgi:predicted nucleotidyltransferase